MPSWPQILTSIAEAWQERREELMHSANDILGELRRLSVTEMPLGGVDESLLDIAFESFVRSFDAKNGGWGAAPKFPQAMSLEFLLRYWKRTGNENALEMVKHTAVKMANGGIYDQLGGGFHRYATDAIWLVPHFEKMLYDNAQLIRVYLHLFQITKDEFFKRIATETLEYVTREMLDANGAFYSTQDADSEGEEGKFFVWTPEQVGELLGEEDAQIFDFFYDISDDGNFEEKNIPNVKMSRADICEALKITDQRLGEVIEKGKKILFEMREKRIKPFRDEKVLTAWNGLMLAAFAEASAVLGNDEYLEIAKRNADFLLRELVDSGENQPVPIESIGTPRSSRKEGSFSGRLLRTWKDGTAKLNGYIEDYANFADGLIELYQVGGEIKYLTEAKRLADAMITEFWDEENGGFFFTSNDHEELIVRNKDLYDNATPSGNSVAADVLLKLAKFFGEEKYERFASTVLRIAAVQAKRHPQGFGRLLAAAEFYLSGAKEIVIAGKRGNELEHEIWSEYRPAKVVAVSVDPAVDGELLPLVKDRHMIDGKPTAYVCENFVCQRPVTTVEELKELL